MIDEQETVRRFGKKPKDLTLKDIFPETLDADGVDMSLISALEMQQLELYGKTRLYLKNKYPAKPGEDPDDIDIKEATYDGKADLFMTLLFQAKTIFDKAERLQALCSDYEKYCIRLYWHMVYNWNLPECRKNYTARDIYEVTEAYFKIMRKYHEPTFEEPYYFLSPKEKRDVLFEADMLKRTSHYDDAEIKISLLEGTE